MLSSILRVLAEKLQHSPRSNPRTQSSLTAPGGAELPPIMLPRIKLLRRSIARFFEISYMKGGIVYFDRNFSFRVLY